VTHDSKNELLAYNFIKLVVAELSLLCSLLFTCQLSDCKKWFRNTVRWANNFTAKTHAPCSV